MRLHGAGMICTRCSPRQVAEDAIHEARGICMREYAAAPEVSVYGDPTFSFPYVPSHLHHMTFELVTSLLCSQQTGSLDEAPPQHVAVSAWGSSSPLATGILASSVAHRIALARLCLPAFSCAYGIEASCKEAKALRGGPRFCR